MGGENPAARIWKNTNRLADQIRTEAQLVVQGLKSPGQIKRELMHDYDVSFHQAERLIDTEISYVLNKANLEQYRRYGVGKVTIINLDVNDSSRDTAQGAGATSPGGAIGTQPGAAAACAEAQRRQCVTCEKCKALEGQVFRIEDAPVLPIHPRCHCSYCVPAEGDDAEVTASGLDLASVYADAGIEGYERVSAGDGRKLTFTMAEIRSEPEALQGRMSGTMQDSAVVAVSATTAKAETETAKTLENKGFSGVSVLQGDTESDIIETGTWYERNIVGKPEMEGKYQSALEKAKAGRYLKGELRQPEIPEDIERFTYNAEHANNERGHGVSEEEALMYIREAVVEERRNGGVYRNYFGPDGCAYILTRKKEIKTAFKAAQFTPNISALLEVMLDRIGDQ